MLFLLWAGRVFIRAKAIIPGEVVFVILVDSYDLSYIDFF